MCVSWLVVITSVGKDSRGIEHVHYLRVTSAKPASTKHFVHITYKRPQVNSTANLGGCFEYCYFYKYSDAVSFLCKNKTA